MIKTWIPSEPVIHINDSDVVKPEGYKFESLGIVSDGSESTSTKSVYKKFIMLQKPVPYLQQSSCQHIFKNALLRRKEL